MYFDKTDTRQWIQGAHDGFQSNTYLFKYFCYLNICRLTYSGDVFIVIEAGITHMHMTRSVTGTLHTTIIHAHIPTSSGIQHHHWQALC